MSYETLITALPTALSAGLFTTTHLVFFRGMSARSAPQLPLVPPRVSILKPVTGHDDGLLENLATFTNLDYPDYELLLGLPSPEDPAAPTVRAFLAAHPDLRARLVWTYPPQRPNFNPKVAQLISLARAARGTVFVVSDANARVPRSYLRSLVAALCRPGVGLVSSVVLGAGERTLAAAIDNAQQNSYIAPSIVAAHKLGLWPITVGKSMAMHRGALCAVGGFESVASVLAEDDVLGQRFDAKGYKVEICVDPVLNHNAESSWARTLERHTRWAMLRRSITPLGFACELLLSPLLVAAAVALIARTRLALDLLGGALLLTFGGALLSLTRAGVRNALLLAALEPLRVAAMFLCWCRGCLGRRVTWRGHTFALAGGSRLVPLETAPRPAPLATLTRLTTLARTLVAGGAATLVDLTVLAFAVGVLHASPRAANVPALLVGAAVQFFGNRHFAFRAASGRIARQALLFLAAEALALVFNAALYHAVATWIPLTQSGALLARLFTTNLVFLLWSYPVWRRIFQPAAGGALARRGIYTPPGRVVVLVRGDS